MTANSISLSPRTAATAIGRNWFRILLLGTIFLFGLAPRRVAAQAMPCPGPVTTITGNVNLTGTMTPPAGWIGPCIILENDGLTVNLAGFSIDVSSLGDAGVAIDTTTTNNAAILATGGSIITAYSTSAALSAIESEGGTNLTITGVSILNKPGATLCTLTARNQNWGAGITLASLTSANISTNTIECYQTGISISNSAIPRRATGLVSGNMLQNDEYTNSSLPFALGAGLVLSNSSGWSIQNNFITYDGSLNASLGCSDLPASPTTDPTDCSPAVELLGGSSGNTISGNAVNSNFAPGIFTASTTSGNKILNNTLFGNSIADLWDAAPPHSNAWRGNTCTVALGNVAPQKCPH
ncbi:MAG TPA: right-handed parallel beta-helix repeat-containing protein [Candidatus Acidoferrales bacterium]|nr:right-handed parallel beta-helix repeat-containing protein [Candidatus Acidoferrales bacterium]